MTDQTTDRDQSSTNPETIRSLERLSRQFMEPDIDGPVEYWEVSADHGSTYIVPCSVGGDATTDNLQEYVEARIDTDADGHPIAERKIGYLARLSAPGYLDSTEWSAFETRAEAEEYIAETYDDGEEETEEEEEETDRPGEEDIYSEEGSHSGPFYYCHKRIAETRAELRAWMTKEQYWPTVWYTSDHGNQWPIVDIADETKD